MAATLQELTKQYDEKLKAVNELYEKVGDDNPTAEVRNQVKDLNKELEQIELQIADNKDWNADQERNAARKKMLETPVGSFSHPDADPDKTANVGKKAQSVGEQYINAPEYKDWVKVQAPSGGTISEKKQVGTSPAFAIPGGYKTLITGTSDTSAGALVQIDYRPLVELPFRPMVLRDLITVLSTGSDQISYPREVSRTNAAAPVAEATAISGGVGTKPESGFVLEVINDTIKTIAHWIPVTKRALADAPQIRSIIDTFGRNGLEEELEDQIIQGDGVGENFTGLQITTGTTAQAWDTNILTTTRKARTKVRTTGRATPNGYLLHPTDWETIDLLQDNENRYYFGGPSQIGTPRLWGLPVIESEALDVGEGFVGDFKTMVLWDREQATVQMSDSHSDFFIRNLVAVLFEMRAGFGVLRPAAIVEMDLVA